MPANDGGKVTKPGVGSGKTKSVDAKKPRAQPGDFERQVDQIRKDIDSVRNNLKDAEKALGETEAMNSTAATKLGEVDANDGSDGE